MKRRLKMVALSVLALGALQASAAQAEGNFRADSYPATLSASQTGLNTFAINGGTITVACTSDQYSGVVTGTAGAIDVAPSYAGCSANGGTTVTIKPNGCTYGWSIAALGGGGSATGTQSISCPEGKEVEIGRYLGGELRCLYALPSQGPNTSVTYQNQGSGSTATVEATLNVGMQGKVLFGGAVYCGKGAGNPISINYSGGIEISTLGEASEAVGFSVGGAGLYLEGEESAEPSQQPRFVSELATEPLSVVGSTTKAHLIDLKIRKAECSSVSLTGELTGSATELPLDAVYGGCVGNGSTQVTISMNSCSYVLNVLNAGPPYAGSLDLACAKEGDGMQIQIWATGVKPEAGKELCVIKIPAQEGLGPVGLQTVGSGYDRQVAVDFAIAGLDYQRITGTAVNCGAANGTNGAYTGGSTLAGL